MHVEWRVRIGSTPFWRRGFLVSLTLLLEQDPLEHVRPVVRALLAYDKKIRQREQPPAWFPFSGAEDVVEPEVE